MMTIRTTHLLTRMWLHSGHNNNDPNNRINSKEQTIGETNPRANPTTGCLFKGTSQQLRTKDPTLPETVNSVSTAKF
jgi:hypothetical protein